VREYVAVCWTARSKYRGSILLVNVNNVFFLSVSQNNALDVYLQYATGYCQSLSHVCFVRSVPVPVL